MDKTILVTEQITAAKELIEHLSQSGFEVAAALWVKTSRDGQWRFHVVSPIVDELGHPGGYLRLDSVLRKMQRPWNSASSEVRLLGLSDRLGKEALEIPNTYPYPLDYPIHWPGNWLAGMAVDDLYLFPAPVAAQ